MRRPVALAILGLLGLCGRAGAQGEAPSAPAVAQALFEQGRDDMKRGAYLAACPKFEESHRLDPSNGTLLNLVLCDEAIGKVASAWVHARELADRLPADDDRRPIAERKLAALARRLPRLAVRLEPDAPEGTKVLLDAVELRPSSLGVPIPIDPGSHTLVVTAPGRPDRGQAIAIVEGQQLEWIARVAAERPEPVVAIGVPEVAPPALSSPPTWVPWATLGVGAASLLAGGVLAALALDRRSTVLEDCPNKNCSDSAGLDAASEGQGFFIGSLVALGAGAAGTGVGAYLVARGSARPRPVGPAPQGLVMTYSADF